MCCGSWLFPSNGSLSFGGWCHQVDAWLVVPRLLMHIMIAALVNTEPRVGDQGDWHRGVEAVTADGPQNQYAFEYAAGAAEERDESRDQGSCRGDRRQTTAHTTFHARDPTSQLSTFILPLCKRKELPVGEPF